MSEASEVILLFGGYITAQIASLPPISVIISVTENKALSEEEATAQGSVPSRRTEIRIMSQIWQSCSLYRLSPGLAVLWVRNSGGINRELTQRTPLHHMKTLPESLAESSEDHMLRMWASNSQTDTSRQFLFGLSEIYLLSTCHMTIWCSTAAQKHSGKHECFSSQFWHSLSVMHSSVSLILLIFSGHETQDCCWFSGWFTSFD